MKCPYCNGDVEAGSQFCIHCGRKIHLHTVEEFSYTEQEPQESAAQEPSESMAQESLGPAAWESTAEPAETSQREDTPQYSPYYAEPRKNNSSKGLLIGLIAAVVCAFLFGGLALMESQKLASAEADLSTMQAQVDYYSALADVYEEKAAFLDENVVFVVDDDDIYYYHYDSYAFQNAESYYAFNINLAEYYGYIPYPYDN